MKKHFKWLIALVSIFMFATGAIAATNKANWGDSVYIDSSGIIYAGQGISMGAVIKTSWGSVISPWEDDGTTTILTSAPTKFILTHSTGVSYATGFSVGAGDITFVEGGKIDGDTNNAIKFVENSDTLSFTFSGNDIVVDSSDGGIMFTLTDATDGTVDIMTNNDADDYIQFSTTSDEPLLNWVGCDAKITAAGGDISFDNENLLTTGTLGAGATTVTSLIIGDDTYDVVTDDQFRFASNDEESTIEAYGFEAKDGVLQLTADEGDDAGDKIQLVSDQATNSLFFTSDTAVKDTHATILTLAKTGLLTTTSDIYIVNDTATTNAVVDVLKVEVTSTGTAAAGLGVGIVFSVEDEATTPEEQASIDVAMTTSTNAAEDADMIFKINTAGAIAEVVRFVAASSATTGDSVTITQNTTETDGIIDILSLANVTGTATHNAGLGITWDFEDAAGAEEQASLDVQLTTATDGAEDVAIIFSQQTAGAIAETLRIQGASSATVGDSLEFTSNTTETNAVIDIVKLKIATGTAANGAGMGISFEPEDATGSEQHGSIDLVLTTAARTTCDSDFVFTQDVNGTLEERVRFDADDDTILLTGTLPKMTIGDGGDEDAILTFDGQTNDFYVGFDTTDDLLNIGVGSTPGTTCAIEIDASANVIITSGMKIPYQIHAAADTLTINEGSKLHVFDDTTEYKLTLPSVATSAGIHYHIVVGIAPAGTAFTIGTDSGENLIYGLATVNGAVIGAQAEDLITFTASAAVIGDWIDLYCDGVNWYVSGQAFAATGIVFTAT